jgi:hypothetical protein
MYQCPCCGVAFAKPSFSKMMATGIVCPDCKTDLEIVTGFRSLKIAAALMLGVSSVMRLLDGLNHLVTEGITLIAVILSLAAVIIYVRESTNPRLQIAKKPESLSLN